VFAVHGECNVSWLLKEERPSFSLLPPVSYLEGAIVGAEVAEVDNVKVAGMGVAVAAAFCRGRWRRRFRWR
jgi:hypothetical protein